MVGFTTLSKPKVAEGVKGTGLSGGRRVPEGKDDGDVVKCGEEPPVEPQIAGRGTEPDVTKVSRTKEKKEGETRKRKPRFEVKNFYCIRQSLYVNSSLLLFVNTR